MRIGIDVREMQYGFGGIARYTLNILRVLRDTDNEIILFGTVPIISDLQTIVVPTSKIPLVEDQINLCKLVRKADIDLFLSPYYKIPLFINCRSAITIHDFTVLKTGILPFLFRLYFRIMVNIYARKADMILTVSECSKKDILNYCRIDEEKVKVIYNMVADEFKPDFSDKYRKYGLSENYILYVGNLCLHKNLDALINAYALLGEDTKAKYHLAIIAKTTGVIGRIDQRTRYNELVELSKKLKIIDKIRFIDFVEDNDLPNLYTHAGVLVIPSYYEGFGLPIVEAFACGCPVIGANTSSIPEIANNATIFFNPDDFRELSDKIELVLNDNKVREGLKTNGFKRVDDFRYNKIKEKVTNLL